MVTKDSKMKVLKQGFEVSKGNNGFVNLRQEIPSWRGGKKTSKPMAQVYDMDAFKATHAANLLGSGYHWNVDACPEDLPAHFYTNEKFAAYLKEQAEKKAKESAK